MCANTFISPLPQLDHVLRRQGRMEHMVNICSIGGDFTCPSLGVRVNTDMSVVASLDRHRETHPVQAAAAADRLTLRPKVATSMARLAPNRNPASVEYRSLAGWLTSL
jgi:hypothetical protein